MRTTLSLMLPPPANARRRARQTAAGGRHVQTPSDTKEDWGQPAESHSQIQLQERLEFFFFSAPLESFNPPPGGSPIKSGRDNLASARFAPAKPPQRSVQPSIGRTALNFCSERRIYSLKIDYSQRRRPKLWGKKKSAAVNNKKTVRLDNYFYRSASPTWPFAAISSCNNRSLVILRVTAGLLLPQHPATRFSVQGFNIKNFWGCQSYRKTKGWKCLIFWQHLA